MVRRWSERTVVNGEVILASKDMRPRALQIRSEMPEVDVDLANYDRM